MSAATKPATDTLLSVKGVVMAFGGLVALRGVDLDVAQGEHLAILGPNGAGKTTLFNVIAGDLTPTRGSVTIGDVDVTHLPQRARTGLGVARTYQKTRLFGGLSVSDNLYLSIIGRHGNHYRLLPDRQGAQRREHARQIARQVWLSGSLDIPVASLSHGQKRQLEVGMALACDPTVVMLDEPASGLSRGERERLTHMLQEMPHTVTLLLIEHDMDVALQVAERVVVMSDGDMVAGGTPEEIRHNEMVRDIYLGTEQ